VHGWQQVAVALRAGTVLLSLLAVSAPPAEAQSFPQSLFGYPPPRVYHYPGLSPYRFRGAPPHPGVFRPYRPYADDPSLLPMAQSYRTLCVRLCDGFYFPISSVASQDMLARDADTCSASCGAEARLFHHPNGGGDVDSMVDLTGIAYSALPNAFKYRKTLVEGCRCRPQPWSEAELARHRAYTEGREAPRGFGDSIAAGDGARPKISSGQPQAGDFLPGPRDEGDEELAPIARPPPIVREVAPRSHYPAPGEWGLPPSRYGWPERYRR
jgi:Protein of unknown function (DUF2865)